jgi:hypothetical protein
MSLRALTFATGIKGRLAGSVMAALTLASIGSAVFAMPAAAARAHADTVTDSIRSGPYASRHVSQAPATGARTARPAVAPRVSSSCDSTFHPNNPTVNPGLVYNAISNNGLAAISPSDVWAVGANGDSSAGPDRTLALKWNGSSWSQVATPNIIVGTGTTAGNDDLWGVTTVPGAAADIGNVWTVGDITDAVLSIEHPQALVSAAPGTNGPWTVYQPANIGGGNNILFGVTAIAANNVWAVGNSRNFNGDPATNTPPSPAQTLIGHWDGTTFTTASGPQTSVTSSDRLIGVSGSGASDVWAVGRTTDNGVDNTLILHYNGSTWSASPSVNPSATSNTLYGVTALSPTLAYAVGDYKDANGLARTLIEKWDGALWTKVPSPDATPIYDNYLFSISAVSPTNIWIGGADYAPNGGLIPSYTFFEHWNGTAWNVMPGADGNPGNFNEFNAILAISPTEVWAAGDFVNTSNQLVTLADHLCMSIPTVTGVVPLIGAATGGNTVAISGTDFLFATAVKFGATDATTFAISSDSQIIATVPAGVAGTVDVTVTNAAGTSATSVADSYVYVPPAISWRQYSLAASNGTSWTPIDMGVLGLSFTPSVASNAILSGNADLWTSLAGVNQDIGIWVTGGVYGTSGVGTVVAWKESGGYAGTFSPNAAFVQTSIPVAAATTYYARLVWKSNKATNGTIFAAAGNSPYSPTRLTAELVPATSPNLQSVATNNQYWLIGSNGTTWQDMDGTGGLTIANFTPGVTGSALVSANVDLWTATGGVNQDVGIFVSGGAYTTGTSLGTIVGWKESGGFAGTLSPNAAYAQSVIQLVAATQYTIKVQWKANKSTAGTIYAAAGNAGAYSPTRLTLRLFPAGTGLQDAVTNAQYFKPSSTGTDWTPIDLQNLKLTVVPTANSLYGLSANVDLWTATAGVNQDVAIFISGGAYGSGSGTLVAWKESGGFAGTFSPNAAFVQTVLPLAMNVTYTVTLEWKANKATTGVIYAGAGGAGNYSPTRLTAQLLS